MQAYGGDSDAVQEDLDSGVDTVYSTLRAFAALKVNGSVVTWGDAQYGGDRYRSCRMRVRACSVFSA